MAKSSNAFDVLTDYENEELSLLIADHLKETMKKSKSKSPEPTRKTLAPSKSISQAAQQESVKQANFGRGSDDLQNKFVLERSFFRKFGVSEDGEFEKPEISRGLRLESRGGPRRSYRICSRFFCHPGREYIDEETEDYAVKMSSKYRLFDRYSPCGRSNGGKSEGFGRSNWGTMMGDQELELWSAELANSIEDDMIDNQSDEDESVNEEMTLDEYENVRNEQKRALQAMLLELATAQKDDEDLLNEFEIIDKAEAEGFQL